MSGQPLVLCLTNTVAANFTANVLLAIGAKPAMTEDSSDAACLAESADALLVNIGTVTRDQADVMRAALRVAIAHGKPWVLDPVACQVTPFRRALAEEFLALRPTAVRGNAAEISYLRSLTEAVPDDIPMLATGEVDRLYAGSAAQEIAGGVPMLQNITATGCAQGGIVAAFLGQGFKPVEAALKAARLMKSAGERAWAKAKTPGGFQSALLDALWELSHD